MDADHFASLGPAWTWATPLRSRFARRQALVELDVLAAQALGLTLDELQTIYRVQFPVLRKYEENTWYDVNGRIIYTKNRGLTGVGLSSKEFDDVRDLQRGTVEQTIEDDTQPGGPVERTIVYDAPFAQYDREADYAEAWAFFEGRTGDDAPPVAASVAEDPGAAPDEPEWAALRAHLPPGEAVDRDVLLERAAQAMGEPLTREVRSRLNTCLRRQIDAGRLEAIDSWAQIRRLP